MLSRRIRLLGSLVLLLFVMLVARVGLRVASVLPASGLPLKRDTGGVPLVDQGFAVLLLGEGLCLVETLQLWAILVYCWCKAASYRRAVQPQSGDFCPRITGVPCAGSARVDACRGSLSPRYGRYHGD